MTTKLKLALRRVDKFLDLPAKRQRRVLYAVLLVLTVRAALWVLPYRILQRLADVKPRANVPADEARRTALDITAVSRYVPRASCLTQALVAQVLLRRDGFSPTLRLGVTHDQHGKFKAHAWIELHGRIIVGDLGEEMSYTPLHVSGRAA